jgi:hypothetical protein
MDLPTNARRAGFVTPINDEGHNSPKVAAPNTFETQRNNPTAGIIPLQAPRKATENDTEKAFNTLRAQFALLGHVLTRTDGENGAGGFNCVRWGMARHLTDLEAARRFLVQVGGTPERGDQP